MESLRAHEVSQNDPIVSRLSQARTADVLVDILAEAGVEVIFGLPGGPISPIHDALMDRPGIRVITTRHESGAMFAAAGYAQTSGKLGVAVVTSGPGVLNAMTGLASAFCDGLPVLLLVGEVARKNYGKGALQDGSAYALNIVGMARHITKMCEEVYEPNNAPAVLRRAIATALSGRRGPVALTLPMDTTSSKIVAPDVALATSCELSIAPSALESATRLLGESRRTAVFAGSGLRTGDGPSLLRDFAERLQCPVITTPKGKGVFPENHPLSLGVFGMGGHPSATTFLSGGVDTLVAIGTSLGDIQTEGWSSLLKPRRAFIHVDIDAKQIGRSYPVTLGVAAPADLFLRGMLARLPQSPLRSFGGIQRHARPELAGNGSEGKIAPQRAVWEMQQVLAPDTIFTCDSGEHYLFATHYIEAVRPDGYIVMSGLGSMGSSIGAAIGARLARPDRPVAAICGDGCFAMNAFEVATAVAEGVPIVVFVMNDARLAMVEIGHNSVYGRAPAYPTSPMDVATLGAALGARSLVVERAGDLLAAADLLRNPSGPVVVDVRIDPTVKMPKKERFTVAAPSRSGVRIIN